MKTDLEMSREDLYQRLETVQSAEVMEQVRLIVEEYLLLADGETQPELDPPMSEAELRQLLARSEKDIAEGNVYTHEEVVAMMRKRFES